MKKEWVGSDHRGEKKFFRAALGGQVDLEIEGQNKTSGGKS